MMPCPTSSTGPLAASATSRSAAALARRQGPGGVVMRVKNSDESHEMDMLPKDGQRYDDGNMVSLIFPQSPQ